MKIVHITYGFGLGGIETMLHNIANEQVKLGHEIHIIVINDIVNDELKSTLASEIHFHCLKRKVGSKNPFFIFSLNTLLFNIHPDVVHLHYSSIARYMLLGHLKKKLCVTQHDVCNKQNSEYLYLSKKIFAISDIVKKDILKWTGLDSEVVLNGIEPGLIKASSGERHSKFGIVQVSRLMHEKKGQHILIKAVAYLVEKGYKDICLDFIGDGESIDYLKQLARKLKVESYVNFLGAKDQSYIFEHLCKYDLYVQPSIYEGFGLTVTEGMAAKIPVLVSKNQGPLEIIDYGKYGYSFKNKDSEDCALKIEKFLKRENDTNMITLAYERVLSLYDVKNTAQKYLELYKTLA